MPKATPIESIDASGSVLKTFASQLQAANHYGIRQSSIGYCLLEGCPCVRGVWFRYAGDVSARLRKSIGRRRITVNVGARAYPSIKHAARGEGVAYATMWARSMNIPLQRKSRLRLGQVTVYPADIGECPAT